MQSRIRDLMVEQVIIATPSQTVGHVRDVMSRNKVSALPVVDPDGQPVGIISTTDLLENGHADATPVSKIMTRRMYTIPQYESTHIAARMMRNHHIHHLVVTHEQKVVGILSAYDLLRLVEEHRYVSKSPPTESGRPSGERKRTESGI